MDKGFREIMDAAEEAIFLEVGFKDAYGLEGGVVLQQEGGIALVREAGFYLLQCSVEEVFELKFHRVRLVVLGG